MARRVPRFLKLLKEVRGNAIWDLIKWVFRNHVLIISVIVGLFSGFFGWLKSQPLPILIVLTFGVGVLTYLALVVIEDYLKEDSEGADPVEPKFDQEPQAASVALDQLKEMLRDGEEMVSRFSYGELPTLDEIKEYRAMTLAAAKWRVFEPNRVTLEDIERFKEGWDDDDVLRKKAALLDAGRLPELVIDPDGFLAFDRLYGRVERLKELIGVITGKVPHAVPQPEPPPPEAPNLFPDFMKIPKREDGPKVVPPRKPESN